MCYISPICSEALHGRICTKFCEAVEVVDIITCDKFFSDWLRDVDSVRGGKSLKVKLVSKHLALGRFPVTKANFFLIIVL